jgi:TorA maturation chaperone TorD
MELLRALGVLCEPPAPSQAAVAETLGLSGAREDAEHADLFLFQLYPYASVYLGPEGMLGGEARDRVAGFWRALRLAPPPEPDHLASLLGLAAGLAEAEGMERNPARRRLAREARSALLWEHLLSWLPPYLTKLDEIASPFYRRWASLLRGALDAQADELEVGGPLPLHLRSAPALEPPGAVGAKDFLDGLLAPVRSGMILVRDDLARAARELGLGLRVAERRFVLAALLEQDAAATLSWLAAEAARWERLHRTGAVKSDPIATFWADRASRTARILRVEAEAALEAVDLERVE